MGTLVHYTNLSVSPPRLKLYSFKTVSSSLGVSIRQEGLKQLDKVLVEGDEKAALSIVKDLQGKPNGLLCFGAARQV